MADLSSWQRKPPESTSGSSSANQVSHHIISRMVLDPHSPVSLEERRWMHIEEIIRQNEERRAADTSEPTNEGGREPEEEGPTSLESQRNPESSSTSIPVRGPFDRYGTCLPWADILRQQGRNQDWTHNTGGSRQEPSQESDVGSRSGQPVQGRGTDTSEPTKEGEREPEEESQRVSGSRRDQENSSRSSPVSGPFDRYGNCRSLAEIIQMLKRKQAVTHNTEESRQEPSRESNVGSRSGQPVEGRVANASETNREINREAEEESQRENSPVRGRSRIVSSSQRAHQRRAADRNGPTNEGEREPEEESQEEPRSPVRGQFDRYGIRPSWNEILRQQGRVQDGTLNTEESRQEPSRESDVGSRSGHPIEDANLRLRQSEMARRERKGDPIEPIRVEEESRRSPSYSRAGHSRDHRRSNRDERHRKRHKHKKRRRRSSEGSRSEEGHRKRHKKHRKSRRSRSRSRSPRRSRGQRRSRSPRRIRREDEEEAARIPKGPIDITDYIPNGFNRFSEKHPISRRTADLLSTEIRYIGRANNCSLSYDKIDFPGPEMRYIYMRGEEEDIERARKEIDEEGIRCLERQYEYEQTELEEEERTEFTFMYWIRSGCVVYFAMEDFTEIIKALENYLNVRIERVATNPRVLKIVGWNFRWVKECLNRCCDELDEPPITKKFTIRTKLYFELRDKVGMFELDKKTFTRIHIAYEGKVTYSLTVTGLSKDVDEVERIIRQAITELYPDPTNKEYAFTMVLNEKERDSVYGYRERPLTRIKEQCQVEMQMGEIRLDGTNVLYIEGDVDHVLEAAIMVRFEASKRRQNLISREVLRYLTRICCDFE